MPNTETKQTIEQLNLARSLALRLIFVNREQPKEYIALVGEAHALLAH